MVNRGLLVRLEAKPGHDEGVETFLKSALPLVRQEPGTTAWFALRFGRSEYGIFDVFADDAARDAHLNGAVARTLIAESDRLFARQPHIQKIDILSDKLPAGEPAQAVTKGLLLGFKAKALHEPQVVQFLRDANPLVQQEPRTTAWFALLFEDGSYGIFDVFPDQGGRFAHLTGHVPRELAKHALSLLGSVPDMDMLNILAAHFAAPTQ
jgi:quinol monooxygenase YgiN